MNEWFEDDRFWSGTAFYMFDEERRLDPGCKAIRSTWTVLRGNEREEFHLRTGLFSGAEFESLLFDAGFREVTLHGWLDGRPYDHEALRLVAVACARS